MDKIMDNIADNSLVAKVMTFKAGNFPFSRRYDRAKVKPLLLEIMILREAVEKVPILPAYVAHLKKSVIFKSIHSTAALEGNPLSEEQVEELLERGAPIPGKEDFAQEIKNLESTYEFYKLDSIPFVFDSETGQTLPLWIPLGEDEIQRMHEMLTEGISHPLNVPGRYREHWVEVGDKTHGGTYKPPKILADIQKLMDAFVQWIHSPGLVKEPPAVRAALAHYHLALIHPFSDGNGRTCRILEAWLLQQEGFHHVPVMLSNYYYQHVDDYYWAFSLCRKNKDHDMTPFVEFMLKGLVASLREAQDSITGFIRVFALRDHFRQLRKSKALSKRLHDLLSLLLDKDLDFTLRDLMETVPYSLLYGDVGERTARRDLARLTEMKLLRRDDQGRYRLNRRILG